MLSFGNIGSRCSLLGKCCRPIICCCCWPCVSFLRIIRGLINIFARHVNPFFLVSVALFGLFCGEFVVYWQASSQWRSDIAVHDNESPGQSTIRFLLVGDPQLVGEENELPVIGVLTRWDADRFMQKTFSSAFEIARPHVVIFVGDLLDEGGIASNESLARYSRRFEQIFNPRRNKLSPNDARETDQNKAQFVAYWGDNDVQMEDELIYELVDNYRRRVILEAFALGLDLVDLAPCRKLVGGTVVMRHYDFLLTDNSNVYDQGCNDAEHFQPAKVMFGQLSSTESKKLATERNFNTSHNQVFKMLLSHYPLVGPWAGESMNKPIFAAVRTFGPHFVISAHIHGAVIIWCDNCLDAGDDLFVPVYGYQPVQQGDKPYMLPLPHPGRGDAPQPHIIVPTVSYRMGVKETGYGILTLNPGNHTLIYSVFWNPYRYSVLNLYMIGAIIIAFWLFSKAFVAFENSDYYQSFQMKRRTHLP